MKLETLRKHLENISNETLVEYLKRRGHMPKSYIVEFIGEDLLEADRKLKYSELVAKYRRQVIDGYIDMLTSI